MNIGIFTDCYLPTKNGVVTSIIQLKEGLERRGHKAIVVTVNTPYYEEKETGVYRFPSIPLNSDLEIRLGLANPRAVQRIVKQEHIDIIHTHTEFSLGWMAKCVARRLNLPLVHTAHTMYEEYRHYLSFGKLVSPKMIQRLFTRFLCNYDALICPSMKVEKYFKSFLPAIRTIVIGNGVCETRFGPHLLTREEKEHTRQALGIQASEKIVLYVGRMAKEKRVVELLNVLTPLLQANPQYKILFVGSGPSRSHLVDIAKKHNIREQVIFTGYVHWEYIYRLYSIACVFVTASLSEVHPMTVLEAIMCGLPVVARRDESYVDLIEDDYNGYLVDSDRQIATRVSETLRDELTWLRLSQNGLTASERFTAETHVEKVESFYQHVMRDSARRGKPVMSNTW